MVEFAGGSRGDVASARLQKLHSPAPITNSDGFCMSRPASWPVAVVSAY